MKKYFNNKNVVITGAASGIGKLMAEKIASYGGHVFLLDINLSNAEAIAADIIKKGGKAKAVEVDVASIESMKKARSEVIAISSTIDILINNAGVVFGGDFEKAELSKHLLTYQVNTLGPVALTHLFFEDLRKSKEANIVNIASASGLIGLPYGTTYASSKWALLGFSESLRLEFGERGINNVSVTTICPSYILTGMFEGVRAPLLLPWLNPEEIVAKILDGIALKKPFVKEPFVVKWVDFLKGILPLNVFVFVNRLIGVSRSMEHWKGRRS